ncbi:MAG: type VII secretion protein EccE [Actinomycetota bacterium]
MTNRTPLPDDRAHHDLEEDDMSIIDDTGAGSPAPRPFPGDVPAAARATETVLVAEATTSIAASDDRRAEATTSRQGPAFLRAEWSWWPSRTQLIMLPIGLLIGVLALRDAGPVPPLVAMVVAEVVVLASLPWPTFRPTWWRAARARIVSDRSDLTDRAVDGWINPARALLGDGVPADAPGRGGQRIGILHDDGGWVSAIDVSVADATGRTVDLTDDHVARLADLLAEMLVASGGPELRHQLLATVRTPPDEAICDPVEAWRMEASAMRSLTADEHRGGRRVIVAVRLGRRASTGAVRAVGSDALRGQMRRAVFSMADALGRSGFSARPLPPTELHLELERSTLGPDVSLGDRHLDAGSVAEETSELFRFADRVHMCFEVRSATRAGLDQLVGLLSSAPTVATSLSMTAPAASPNAIWRCGRRLCTVIRLSDVDDVVLRETGDQLERDLDAAGIRWNRMDGRQRDGFLATLPLARRPGSERPRLSWWSAAPRRFRTRWRAREAELARET